MDTKNVGYNGGGLLSCVMCSDQRMRSKVSFRFKLGGFFDSA